MLRKLSGILLIAASAFPASAQDIFDSSETNAPYFGIRLSYELASPTDLNVGHGMAKINMFDNGSGFNIGAIYNIPLWKNLYFEPGASIYYNTFAINRDILNLGDQEFDNASTRQWGLRIPLNLGYHFDILPELRLAFFTGPEFNLSFKGNQHYSVDKYNVTAPLFGDEGIFNRADIKWRFGVGATFATNYYVAISGAVGMCDIFRNDITVSAEELGYPIEATASMRSNIFNFTLGYNF